jgi:signal transduction histidine kinase
MLLAYFFFLTAGIFALYLSVILLVRGGYTSSRKSFMAFSFSLGMWVIHFVLLFHTQHQLFEYLMMISAISAAAILPLFIFMFPRHASPPWYFHVIYLPTIPLLILLCIAAMQALLTGTYTPPLNLFWWYVVTIIGYSILALVLYLKRYNTTHGSDHFRLQHIGIGLSLFALTTVIGAVVLPFFGNTTYMLSAPLSAFLVLLVLLTLAVFRKKVTDLRIVTIEVIVFLSAGIVLLNNVLHATAPLEAAIAILLFAVFIIMSGRLCYTMSCTLEQSEELKCSNKKLEDLMNMKMEFLQIASHQLRAPLTSLYGLVKMEADGYFDTLPSKEKQEMKHSMKESVEQLQELVNDLLRALRIEGTHFQLHFTSVDVLKLLKEAMESIEQNYDERGLYLLLEKPKEPLPPIQADPEYLRQVFINLLDNGEKYTEKGGTMVSAYRHKNRVVIEIVDTGIGIPLDEQKKLFRKFSRADNAQALRHAGSGLGLFIAKKIVEGHNGSLTLKSNGENEGTVATISLPIR